jgi:hypothetical protein
MTEYKWVINQMDCVPKEGTLLNVVSIVHWTRFAQQDNIQFSVYGTMNCATPSKTDFTAYPDLTFEQICQWLEAGLNVSELDASLDSQIKNLINPPIVNLPLPWVK